MKNIISVILISFIFTSIALASPLYHYNEKLCVVKGFYKGNIIIIKDISYQLDGSYIYIGILVSNGRRILISDESLSKKCKY